MPKQRDDDINDGEHEDIEDPVALKDVCGNDEDNEEANDDLILNILEKSNLDDSKETTMSDLEVVNEIIVDDDEVKRPAETPSSTNMVLKKLLRGARYFDPPETGRESCYSCGEEGHIIVNCPTPNKRRKPCFICSSLKHGAKQCPKKNDCYVCKKGDHRAKDCPDTSGSKSDMCLRCGDFGHDMVLCKYEYSQDDLKDIQCYVCKSFGHLCCVEASDSPAWAVSCYRCGQLGHIGLACGRHYEERTENDSASLCFKCGEFGHFSHECDYPSSIRTSQGSDSKNVCNRCNETGHCALECPGFSKISKRNNETRTLSRRKRKKRNLELNSTLHESEEKAKKSKEDSEQKPTLHEFNGNTQSKKNSEHNPTLHESISKQAANGKQKQQKNEGNLESNFTPHESNMNMKKNSVHNSIPNGSNGKAKKKNQRKKRKYALKREQRLTNSQKPKERDFGTIEDPEVDTFRRRNFVMPRSPTTTSGHVAPSSHNHHSLPVAPPHHNHHRLPIASSGHDHHCLHMEPLSQYHHRLLIEPSGLNHHRLHREPLGHDYRFPVTYMDQHHRSPTYSPSWRFLESQSTIPYDRSYMDSSFEYGVHLPSPPRPYHSPPSSLRYPQDHHNRYVDDADLLGPLPPRRQPYYPPPSYHPRLEFPHRQPQPHDLHNVYEPAPSRYCPSYYYEEYARNYDRW